MSFYFLKIWEKSFSIGFYFDEGEENLG